MSAVFLITLHQNSSTGQTLNLFLSSDPQDHVSKHTWQNRVFFLMNLITGCCPKNIPEIRTACFPVTDHSLQMSSSPPVSVLLKCLGCFWDWTSPWWEVTLRWEDCGILVTSQPSLADGMSQINMLPIQGGQGIMLSTSSPPSQSPLNTESVLLNPLFKVFLNNNYWSFILSRSPGLLFIYRTSFDCFFYHFNPIEYNRCLVGVEVNVFFFFPFFLAF